MKKILLIITTIMIFSIAACAPKLDTSDTNVTKKGPSMVSDILDEIKDVHPATAGSSLKALYVVSDIMKMSGSNEYINTAMQDYVNSLKKEELINFSDSVNMVYQRFTDIDEDDINSIFTEEGIDIGKKGFNKNDYNYAEKFLNTLSDIAVRDYSND